MQKAPTVRGMKWFMFGVTVLFGLLAIAAVITGIVMMFMGAIVPGVIALVIAAVLAIMAASVAKSLREVA